MRICFFISCTSIMGCNRIRMYMKTNTKRNGQYLKPWSLGGKPSKASSPTHVKSTPSLSSQDETSWMVSLLPFLSLHTKWYSSCIRKYINPHRKYVNPHHYGPPFEFEAWYGPDSQYESGPSIIDRVF